MQADYYHIACRDLEFVEHSLDTMFYNNIACNAQQVVEKLLKSVLELISVNSDKLLLSHNLTSIYMTISKIDKSINLDVGMLSVLKDVYFDSRYPCDDYLDVDFELCKKLVNLMYDCIEEVNKWRSNRDLDIVEFDRKFLAFPSPFKHLNALAEMSRKDD